MQQFTAIGEIIDDTSYQVEMTQDFNAFRRNMHFFEVRPIAIQPIINDLSFILDKKYWGYKFRFRFFEIPEQDYNLISGLLLQKNITFRLS